MKIAIGLLLLALAGPAAAQTPPADEEPAAAQDTAPETAPEEALPDIDIWSEEDADEEDVFIPTERISADSSIAYPADI